MNWSLAIFPSFEEGSLRPFNKRHATLKQGAAGEVIRLFLQQAFDLPGRAEFKVTSHLLYRRGHPSSKEGKMARLQFIHFLKAETNTLSQHWCKVADRS